MARTQVMALGALDDSRYAGAGGYPGPGGPNTLYDYGAPEPPWLINRAPVPPSTPQQPQNLLRPTDKTLSLTMASTGSPVYALYGLGSPDAQTADTAQRVQMAVTLRSWSYSVLGAVMAGIHGSRRNAGKTGWILGWAALGFVFPLITNGVAIAQGFGKPKGR